MTDRAARTSRTTTTARRDGAESVGKAPERVIQPFGVLGMAVESNEGIALRQWGLWFAGRSSPPPALRGRTKTGRVKRPEPALPPNINERTRMHWRTERRITAYWRGQGFAVARAAELPSMGRVRVSAVIHRTRSRRADQSGDAERLKPLLDGIVDANVVPDDTYRHVEHGSVETVKSTRDGILLIVEALDPLAAGEDGGEG